MSKQTPTSLTIRTPQTSERKEFLNIAAKAARKEAARIWDEVNPPLGPSRGGRPSYRGMVVRACEDVLKNYLKWGKILDYSQAELVEAVARDPKIKSQPISSATIERHVKSWLNNFFRDYDLWPKSKKKANPDTVLFYYELLLKNYISQKYVLPWLKKIPGYPDISNKNLKPFPRELCQKIAIAEKRERQQNVQKEPFLAPLYKKRGLLP